MWLQSCDLDNGQNPRIVLSVNIPTGQTITLTITKPTAEGKVVCGIAYKNKSSEWVCDNLEQVVLALPAVISEIENATSDSPKITYKKTELGMERLLV